jgi:hypothetical protein
MYSRIRTATARTTGYLLTGSLEIALGRFRKFNSKCTKIARRRTSPRTAKIPVWGYLWLAFFSSSKPPYRFSKVVSFWIFLLIRLGLGLGLGLELGLQLGLGVRLGVGFGLLT